MPATAEIISIGDEMTSGARLDTNSQWLCQQLGELGVAVRFLSTTGDSLADNVEIFRIAAGRADVVISTGGLGPTADDLTRDALAALVGRPLVQNDRALAHIEALFARRSRPMPPRNRVQAMLPQGALQIFNPQGTAPGIDLLVPRSGRGPARVFALPGVPAEMKEMYAQSVAPRIVDHLGGHQQVLKRAVVKCFGLGESEMEAKLGEMISRIRQPQVGITVNAATISLRIAAAAEAESVCDAMIAQTRREIFDSVGEYVFGEGEEFELQDALAAALAAGEQRLATIETGCAAPVATWMAGVSPREVYAGGAILTHVDNGEDALRQRLTQLDADWLLVVDGYPSLRPPPQSACDVTITLCGRGPDQYWQHRCGIAGHPAIIHARIGKTAMDFARSKLLGLMEQRR